MKIALRLAGLFFVVASLVMLGADLAGAGAGDPLRPLGALWYELHPASLNLVQAVIERYVWAPLWDPALISLLQLPAAPTCAVLGILLIGLGFLPLWKGSRGPSEGPSEGPPQGPDAERTSGPAQP